MSAQTKSKLFLLIIGILLIANIVTLYFLLGNDKPQSRKRDRWAEHDSLSRIFLQKEIGFNVPQLIQFDSLVKKHREAMKGLMDINKKGKFSQFITVGKDSFADSTINNIINSNAQNQKNIDVQLFTHLKNLRAICTPTQQVKYDTSFYKMWDKNKQKNKQ